MHATKEADPETASNPSDGSSGVIVMEDVRTSIYHPGAEPQSPAYNSGIVHSDSGCMEE